MSTFFRGITKTVPSLFGGIFSERNFDGNPSQHVRPIFVNYMLNTIDYVLHVRLRTGRTALGLLYVITEVKGRECSRLGI
jgi:hypothetical protein